MENRVKVPDSVVAIAGGTASASTPDPDDLVGKFGLPICNGVAHAVETKHPLDRTIGNTCYHQACPTGDRKPAINRTNPSP